MAATTGGMPPTMVPAKATSPQNSRGATPMFLSSTTMSASASGQPSASPNRFPGPLGAAGNQGRPPQFQGAKMIQVPQIGAHPGTSLVSVTIPGANRSLTALSPSVAGGRQATSSRSGTPSMVFGSGTGGLSPMRSASPVSSNVMLMKGPPPAGAVLVKGPPPAGATLIKGPPPAGAILMKGPPPAGATLVKGPPPAGAILMKGPPPAGATLVKGPPPAGMLVKKGPPPTGVMLVKGPPAVQATLGGSQTSQASAGDASGAKSPVPPVAGGVKMLVKGPPAGVPPGKMLAKSMLPPGAIVTKMPPGAVLVKKGPLPGVLVKAAAGGAQSLPSRQASVSSAAGAALAATSDTVSAHPPRPTSPSPTQPPAKSPPRPLPPKRPPPGFSLAKPSAALADTASSAKAGAAAESDSKDHSLLLLDLDENKSEDGKSAGAARGGLLASKPPIAQAKVAVAGDDGAAAVAPAAVVARRTRSNSPNFVEDDLATPLETIELREENVSFSSAHGAASIPTLTAARSLRSTSGVGLRAGPEDAASSQKSHRSAAQLALTTRSSDSLVMEQSDGTQAPNTERRPSRVDAEALDQSKNSDNMGSANSPLLLGMTRRPARGTRIPDGKEATSASPRPPAGVADGAKEARHDPTHKSSSGGSDDSCFDRTMASGKPARPTVAFLPPLKSPSRATPSQLNKKSSSAARQQELMEDDVQRAAYASMARDVLASAPPAGSAAAGMKKLVTERFLSILCPQQYFGTVLKIHHIRYLHHDRSLVEGLRHHNSIFVATIGTVPNSHFYPQLRLEAKDARGVGEDPSGALDTAVILYEAAPANMLFAETELEGKRLLASHTTCESCYIVASSSILFRNPIQYVMPIATLTVRWVPHNVPQAEPQCAVHKRPLELFDPYSKDLVCALCASRQPHSSRYVVLPDALSVDGRRTVMDTLTRQLEEAERSTGKWVAQHQRIVGLAMNKRIAINQQFDMLLAALAAKREEFLEMCDAEFGVALGDAGRDVLIMDEKVHLLRAAVQHLQQDASKSLLSMQIATVAHALRAGEEFPSTFSSAALRAAGVSNGLVPNLERVMAELQAVVVAVDDRAPRSASRGHPQISTRGRSGEKYFTRPSGVSALIPLPTSGSLLESRQGKSHRARQRMDVDVSRHYRRSTPRDRVRRSSLQHLELERSHRAGSRRQRGRLARSNRPLSTHLLTGRSATARPSRRRSPHTHSSRSVSRRTDHDDNDDDDEYEDYYYTSQEDHSNRDAVNDPLRTPPRAVSAPLGRSPAGYSDRHHYSRSPVKSSKRLREAPCRPGDILAGVVAEPGTNGTCLFNTSVSDLLSAAISTGGGRPRPRSVPYVQWTLRVDDPGDWVGVGVGVGATLENLGNAVDLNHLWIVPGSAPGRFLLYLRVSANPSTGQARLGIFDGRKRQIDDGKISQWNATRPCYPQVSFGGRVGKVYLVDPPRLITPS